MQIGRKMIQGHDKNGVALTPERSIVRYGDIRWMYNGTLYSEKRNTVNVILTSCKTDKTIIITSHDLEVEGIELIENLPETE